MRPSRGMGAVMPSKMGKGVKKARRDDADFMQYKEGGKVNAAGNYTKPSLRKRIVYSSKICCNARYWCRTMVCS